MSRISAQRIVIYTRPDTSGVCHRHIILRGQHKDDRLFIKGSNGFLELGIQKIDHDEKSFVRAYSLLELSRIEIEWLDDAKETAFPANSN